MKDRRRKIRTRELREGKRTKHILDMLNDSNFISIIPREFSRPINIAEFLSSVFTRSINFRPFDSDSIIKNRNAMTV